MDVLAVAVTKDGKERVRKTLSSISADNPPNPLKSGTLDVCVKGILSKSWQTKQCYLCPAWDNQPARIEAYDIGDSSGKATKPWKVFSLNALKKATAKHKAGENHLEVTTKKDKFCFSSKDELDIKEWEKYLQSLVGATPATHLDAEDAISHDGSDCHGEDPENVADVLFDDNILYESAEPQMQFEVLIEFNEHSERLKLAGSYMLVINDFALSLMDKSVRRPLCIWPYKCIRRYGKTPTMFSFEVGRRSTTGPGYFSFQTTEGLTIFRHAQAKLEKMRQAEMLAIETIKQQEASHRNPEEGFPRSRSMDSEDKKFNKMQADRKSLPATQPNKSLSLDSNRNISHDLKVGQNKDSSSKLSKKEQKKAEKAKQKEDKKTKSKKNQGNAKNEKGAQNTHGTLERGHPPGHVTGKAVLPPVDQDAATRLKHVEHSAQVTAQKPCPPPSAKKPELKVCSPKPTPTEPEELYALPRGKSCKLKAFPKPEQDTKGQRLYEEPDLPGLNDGAMVHSETNEEPDDCYDEVEPRELPIPKGLVQPVPKGRPAGKSQDRKAPPETTAKPKTSKAPATYSEVEKRSKAWKKQGMESEIHIEHYYVAPPKDQDLYETTEVPPPSHNFPPPITARDFESSSFVDNNYDHLLVQNANPRLLPVLRHGADVTNNPYSETKVTSQPKVEITYTGHEYEEAILSP